MHAVKQLWLIFWHKWKREGGNYDPAWIQSAAFIQDGIKCFMNILKFNWLLNFQLIKLMRSETQQHHAPEANLVLVDFFCLQLILSVAGLVKDLQNQMQHFVQESKSHLWLRLLFLRPCVCGLKTLQVVIYFIQVRIEILEIPNWIC